MTNETKNTREETQERLQAEVERSFACARRHAEKAGAAASFASAAKTLWIAVTWAAAAHEAAANAWIAARNAAKTANEAVCLLDVTEAEQIDDTRADTYAAAENATVQAENASISATWQRRARRATNSACEAAERATQQEMSGDDADIEAADVAAMLHQRAARLMRQGYVACPYDVQSAKPW